MKIFTENISEELLRGLELLHTFLESGENNNSVTLNAQILDDSHEADLKITYSKETGLCKIGYKKKFHFFRALGILKEKESLGSFELSETMSISEVGMLLQLSSNDPLKVSGFQQLMLKMALMGVNFIVLGIDAMYKMDEEPYFGYMRGAYSQEELREFDDFGDMFGIEIIPSIQVLGHMDNVLRHKCYYHLRENANCLLPDSEDTYQFIDKMLEYASAPFRSKRINIGMDETWGLGTGASLNKNGIESQLTIFLRHLNHVKEMADKRGLQLSLYSDMIFSNLSSKHQYLDKDIEITKEAKEQIPDGVTLAFWDYYSVDSDLFYDLFTKHLELAPTVYAGPLHSVSSFVVNYKGTFRSAAAAMKAIKKAKATSMYACPWHDDGAECTDWLTLYGIQFYAEHAYTSAIEINMDCLSERFEACTGLKSKWFLDASLLDEVDCANDDNRWLPNPCKYLLWQDPMEGLFDADVEGLGLNEHYHKTAELLMNDLKEANGDKWIFETAYRLARVLELKAEIGIDLVRHYESKDLSALKQDAIKLNTIAKRVEELRVARRNQWMSTCKAFGWENLDLRFGGLISRLETAEWRINSYLNGETDHLEELEEPRFMNDRIDDKLGNGIWKVYNNIVYLSK